MMDKKICKRLLQYSSVVALGAFLFASDIAKAETLKEALTRTYATNPVLEGERRAYEAVLYAVPEAKAGYRPSVNVTALQEWTQSQNEINGNIPGFQENTDLSTQAAAVEVIQALFRGGRTIAAVGAAKALVKAQSQALASQEQAVLLEAISVFYQLQEAMAIEGLRRKNVAVLAEQLEATQARFDVGELTRTDVSQARSRLSRAQSDLIAAEGDVRQVIARYETVIGPYDGREKGSDSAVFSSKMLESMSLPQTVGQAIQIAVDRNPNILQANFLKQASEHDVDNVFGELLPELNAFGRFSKAYDPSINVSEAEDTSFGVNFSMPLYEGGAVRARIQNNQKIVRQRDADIAAAKRSVRADVIDAWHEYVSSKAQLKAIDDQISAANVALEGVREESRVGSRTILDVLDAEEEYLNAQVSQISAKSQLAVSQFQLVAALGLLNAYYLELPVELYDFQKRYDDVSGRWLFME